MRREAEAGAIRALRPAFVFCCAVILAIAPASVSARAVLPSPSVAAAEASQDWSRCALVEADRYWVCKAWESGECAYAPPDAFHLCMALVHRQCSYAKPADYQFCVGLTDRDCAVVASDHYSLCLGLVDQNCALVRSRDYRFCLGVAGLFARRSEPEWQNQ